MTQNIQYKSPVEMRLGSWLTQLTWMKVADPSTPSVAI